MLWQLDALHFLVVLVRLRFRALWLSRENFRRAVQNEAVGLAKRYKLEIYVHGEPRPGFLAANHTSYTDAVVVEALKGAGSVSKMEVKNYFLIGPIVEKVGTLWVRRDDRDSRVETMQKLNAWNPVRDPIWIFPEGTTTPFGEIGEFKMGVFKAAEHSGHPIQPVVICYNNPMIDWGRDNKKIFISIVHFFSEKVRTSVRCFWLEPVVVGPGEAYSAAEKLRRKMRVYIRRFERDEHGT